MPKGDIELPVERKPLIPSSSESGSFDTKKAGKGETAYRNAANLAMGGDVYGPAKGANWDRKISKRAADTLDRQGRRFTGQSERQVRRNAAAGRPLSTGRRK
jgi:hypothetical protein